MATRIVDFLDRYKSRPFIWGRDDCSLFLADWWRENYGIDPAAHLRGTYSTEAEKKRIVASAGGIVPLVSGIADAVGADIADKPETGYFAVIEPGVGAIFVQGYWVARSETGLAFNRDAQVMRMWAI